MRDLKTYLSVAPVVSTLWFAGLDIVIIMNVLQIYAVLARAISLVLVLCI